MRERLGKIIRAGAVAAGITAAGAGGFQGGRAIEQKSTASALEKAQTPLIEGQTAVLNEITKINQEMGEALAEMHDLTLNPEDTNFLRLALLEIKVKNLEARKVAMENVLRMLELVSKPGGLDELTSDANTMREFKDLQKDLGQLVEPKDTALPDMEGDKPLPDIGDDGQPVPQYEEIPVPKEALPTPEDLGDVPPSLDNKTNRA